jgi:ribonuclease HI
MLVTINTDASFSQETKQGAYAFWAVCNEFKVTKCGIFKNLCITPDDAEMKCIINDLKVVLMGHINIHKIIVNTDSLNAIAVFMGDKEHIRKFSRLRNNIKKYGHIQELYKQILSETKNKVTIEFRHVKAHTSKNDARSFINDWCDKNAKMQLKLAISGGIK